MTSPPDRPGFVAPQFVGCYRHPDRSTGIRCQRCGRPICGECMHPASVGFHCPECIGRGKSEARQPRTRFGGALTRRSVPVTKALIGVTVAVFLLDVVSRGLLSALLAQSNAAIAAGQLWRLVTATFVAGGLFTTLLSVVVLFVVGQALEGMLGGVRFLVLYLLAGLGGATLIFLSAPQSLSLLGGSASVIGLLAANASVKLRQHLDIKPDLILLALLVVANFVLGFPNLYGGLGQLGGAIMGLLGGLVLAYAPRNRRTPVQVIGLAGLAGLCVIAVLVRVVLS